MRLSTFLVSSLLLLPLLSVGPSFQLGVQAQGDCTGDIQPIVWNETVARHALVPHTGGYGDYASIAEDRDKSQEMDWGGGGTNYDPQLHPEEYWMYNQPWPLPALEPLTTDHYTSMSIGNDSAGALRFNLSSQHRTTFCVNLQTVSDNVSSPASADIYLLTTNQYDMYLESYNSNHFYSWMGDFEEVLSDLSPEWRSFNPAGWNTYRDVHQYENRDEVTFSLSLDSPEVYNSLFDSGSYQDFYLIIDTWDNSHDRDAEPLGEVVVADVTVITEERNFILPPWTVPLAFFGMIGAVVVLPFILNSRYMNAGAGTTTNDPSLDTVPLLEQKPIGDSPPPKD